jgi:hypothetical protein
MGATKGRNIRDISKAPKSEKGSTKSRHAQQTKTKVG